MSASPRIRLARARDIEALSAHWLRRKSDDAALEVPTAPYGREHLLDLQAMRNQNLQRWERKVGEPGWGRTWLASAPPTAEILGHASLFAGPLPSESHRGVLGLAVETRAQRRGLAATLMSTLIDWARGAPAVAWIELGVFAHNRPARALYDKLGFVTVGTFEDRFRVYETPIADIRMVMNVED